MKLKKYLHLLVFCLMLNGQQALGLVSGQVKMGKKWLEHDVAGVKSGVASDQTTLSVLLDPIPLIPVGVGASYSMATLEKNDLGAGAKEGSLSQLGLDLVAWVPMMPIITPYAGLRVLLSSTMTIKSEVAGVSSDAEFEMSGNELRVGFKYGLLPLVELLVEGAQGTYKTKPKSGDSFDTSAQTFMIGLDVGI